jgi:hypothetical protein
MKTWRAIVTIGFVISLGVSNLLLLFVLIAHTPLFAQDIDVKRDKDKTVYSIGQSDRIRREEAAERDKALDTVKKMSPIIDQRRTSPQTTTTTPQK